MLDGGTLNDNLRNLLFNAAQHMFTKRVREISFKSDWCEGCVTTDFAFGAIGNIYGYKFTAVVEWNTITTNVTYIAKEADLLMPWHTWHNKSYNELFVTKGEA